jgi:hypothetical protein
MENKGTVTGQEGSLGNMYYRQAEASDEKIIESATDPCVYEGRLGFPESMQRIVLPTLGKR